MSAGFNPSAAPHVGLAEYVFVGFLACLFLIAVWSAIKNWYRCDEPRRLRIVWDQENRPADDGNDGG